MGKVTASDAMAATPVSANLGASVRRCSEASCADLRPSAGAAPRSAASDAMRARRAAHARPPRRRSALQVTLRVVRVRPAYGRRRQLVHSRCAASFLAHAALLRACAASTATRAAAASPTSRQQRHRSAHCRLFECASARAVPGAAAPARQRHARGGRAARAVLGRIWQRRCVAGAFFLCVAPSKRLAR